MSQLNFKFLKDTPITDNEDGFSGFYHKTIAPALSEILQNNSCVHTVALFGGWGTGKSTIIKLLGLNNISDTRVVEFDCWKYEEDPLRRQLLLQIAKDLKLGRKDIDRLEKEFYWDIKKIVGEKTHFSWRRLIRASAYSLLVLIVFRIIAFLFENQISQPLLNLFLFYFFISFIPIVYQFLGDDLKKLVMISPITGTKSRFDSPEQFENSFCSIIKEAKATKIIIVVDNLDRVEPENARNILSTLKTFLEVDHATLDNKNVVFVVPCDFEAIKKTVSNSELAGEFLRKIFNVIIWTPEFIDTDLENYTKELLDKTGDIKNILNNENVILVINEAFVNNPREIKQFINNLISALIVALNSEVKETIEKNVEYLAKVLVLRLQYPVGFQKLKELWYTPENIGQVDYDENQFSKEQQKLFKKFMLNTSRITTDDAEPFIYLKKSVFDARIPDSAKIRQGLIEGMIEETKTLINAEKDKEAIIDFIIALLKKYQTQPEILFKIFISQLEILNNAEFKIERINYFETLGKLIDNRLWNYFENVPVDMLFSFVLSSKKLEPKISGQIVERYLIAFSGDNFKAFQSPQKDLMHSVLINFLKFINLLSEDQRLKLSQIIDQSYSNRPEIFAIFQKHEFQKIFITPEAFIKFILGMNEENFINYPEVLNNYNEFIVNHNLFSTLFKRLKELLEQQNNRGSVSVQQREILLSNVLKIIYQYEQKFSVTPDNEKHRFCELLIAAFNSINPIHERYTAVNLMIFILKHINEPIKSQIVNSINQFFESPQYDKINNVFQFFEKERTAEIIRDHLPSLLNGIRLDSNILKLVYGKADSDTQVKIIRHFIQQRIDLALNLLKELNGKLPNREEIILILLQKAQAVSPPEKKGIYEFIQGELNIEDDLGIRNYATQQITELLTTDDIQSQNAGFEFLKNSNFLNEEKKREIAKNVLEFLRQPGKVLTENNRFSLETIGFLFKVLQGTLQADFLYTVFNMLKSNSNRNTLNVAVSILSEVKPRYIEFEKDFNDLLERLKEWPEGENKSFLVKNIIALNEPNSQKSKKEENYWEQMVKFQID